MNNGLSVPSNDPVECIALELSEWGLSKEQMDIQTEKMSLIKWDRVTGEERERKEE